MKNKEEKDVHLSIEISSVSEKETSKNVNAGEKRLLFWACTGACRGWPWSRVAVLVWASCDEYSHNVLEGHMTIYASIAS